MIDPIDMKITDINCESLGLSRASLMESAGKSLAEEVGKIAVYTFSMPVKIVVFAGSGGNAGDGFVAARYLLNRGFEVDIYLLSENIKDKNSKMNLEILTNLEPRLSHLNIHKITNINNIGNLDHLLNDDNSEAIIIDAILGTGIKKNLRLNIKQTIELINKSNCLTVSVDIPSGMNPFTGEISDIAVKPNYTVSFHKTKIGVDLAGEDLVGGIIICDIGIPIEAEYFTASGDLLRLETREKNSHKGKNGKILIVGGSKDYYGAPSIAGLAALESGVDLVHIVTPTPASLPIKITSPDFIVHELKGEYLNISHIDEILKLVENVDAVLIGPGSGKKEETQKLFNILASKIKKPLVIDADALKCIDNKIIKNKENLILTPHLFEFKTFFANIINDLGINIDNLHLSENITDYKKIHNIITDFQKIVCNIKGTVIVKGEFDLVINSKRFKINKTGNSGMTVGGTGDALAGLTCGLFSQGLDSFDTSVLGIYINGKAGDMAFNEKGYGFTATDLTSYISKVLK